MLLGARREDNIKTDRRDIECKTLKQFGTGVLGGLLNVIMNEPSNPNSGKYNRLTPLKEKNLHHGTGMMIYS
jgi:hypothetical protein